MHMNHPDQKALLDGAWFTTDELAALLAVSASALRRWRTAHPPQGPPYVHMSGGVTRYNEVDVARWLLDRRTDPYWAA